jgi:fructosamine-3-kinase
MTSIDLSFLLPKLTEFQPQGNFQFLTQSLYPIYFLKANPPLIVKVISKIDLAQVEFQSLQFLKEKNVLVPLPYFLFQHSGMAFLIMEYIASNGSKSEENFFQTLTHLYSIRSEFWGWHEDNFIGSLPQRNCQTKDFSEYFWQTRWQPQIQLGIQKGLLSIEFQKRLEKLFQLAMSWKVDKIQPRLIHGDLWAGNAIWNSKGMFLIDPSLSYGHPEQDLSMALLFGGFPNSNLSEILEHVGLNSNGFRQRVAFWQIYPLLVHVNLFGSSYVSQLDHALRTYKL